MRENPLKMLPVGPKEYISFQCTGCGSCCRHVFQSVPVETLDAFRIAKYLRDHDKDISCIDDFWARYADISLLDACGYMVYFLKVKGPDWACIFLEENRCTIHAVNPRACRTYPFAVNPEDGTFLVAQDYPHHFQNKAVRAKNWMKRRMTQEDWEYMALDYSSAIQIARLLKQIPDEERSRAMVLFLHYRYSAYDLDQPFLQQYRHNQTQLIQALSQLAQTSQSQ